MDASLIRAGVERYLRPATIVEAVAMVTEFGDSSRLVGGGTDLSIHLRWASP